MALNTEQFVRAHERFNRDFVVSFVIQNDVHVYVGGDISLGGFSFICDTSPDYLNVGDKLKFKITNTIIGSSYTIELVEIRNILSIENNQYQVGCQIHSLDPTSKSRHALFCEAEDLARQDFDGDVSAKFINKAKDAVIALNLSVGQIESSLHGTHQSSEQVSNAVVEMHLLVSEWQKAVENPNLTDAEKVAIFENQLPLYFEHKSQSTVAVQFFDRLSQRLTHVSKCLLEMAYMFSDQSKFVNEQKWDELMNLFRTAYVSQGDMEAFEKLLSGMTLQEAMVLLLKSQTAPDQAQEDDLDVDDFLF